MRRASWSLAAALLAAAAALPSGRALAQDATLPQRRVGVHWEDGVPRVDFSAMDLVTPSVRERLESMLHQRLVMRVYAYRENGQPIAVSARECRVRYDSWQRDFVVDIADEHGDQTLSFETMTGVVRRCLTARRLTVGRAADYRPHAGERMYFAVLVELNPISPETVQRIRRWLASSGGSRAGDEAFYGPMVSVFINRRIGAAERTLRFRSQLETVPR